MGEAVFVSEWPKLPEPLQTIGRFELHEADLKVSGAFPSSVTCVYAYDLVMNRRAHANIAKHLNVLKPRIFISFKPPAFWRRMKLQAELLSKTIGLKTTGNKTRNREKQKTNNMSVINSIRIFAFERRSTIFLLQIWQFSRHSH